MVFIRDLYALALGGHPEGRDGGLAEGRVGLGHGGDEGGMEHLVEPEFAHGGVSEGPLEVRIEGRQVQQGLVHVEDADSLHALPLSGTPRLKARARMRRRRGP
jgi:hypothetical protein